MKTYVCQTVDAAQQCVVWVEQANFITELSMLSYANASQLLSQTAALFAVAWVCKHLSRTAYQH